MALSREEILKILEETKVLNEGHFLLSSGRHSAQYMQCARLFENAEYSSLLCKEVCEKFADTKIDIVVGPAIGGIIMSYEVSRHLGVKNIFAEKVEGGMALRRGFEIPEGANVLVTEDVVTTGGSVRKVMDVVRAHGGNVVGVASIVDRSNGTVDFGVPFNAVLTTEVISFEPDECPLCKEGKTPAIKLGSGKPNTTK